MSIYSGKVDLVRGFTGCGWRQAEDLLRVLRRYEDGKIGCEDIDRMLAWRRNDSMDCAHHCYCSHNVPEQRTCCKCGYREPEQLAQYWR